MLIEVGDFCHRASHDIDSLISDLQDETERTTPTERQAWSESLPRLARVIQQPALTHFHLHLGETGSLSLEYRLPASASHCDAVLLGRGETEPSAVIVELKNWDLRDDCPGPREGLIEHLGQVHLHPADQVRGYTEYCQRFHSAVLDAQADIAGCVYFTGIGRADMYRKPPHEVLVARHPVFACGEDDGDDEFLQYLLRRLRRPDRQFAEEFEAGWYKQDREFIRQVAATIDDPDSSPFVLLDEQRRGFELCLRQIDRMLADGKRTKRVVIVNGPPGSGKSVLAAHLWAALAQDDRIEGNVAFTTTSGCQRSNWQELFEMTRRGARGCVVPANQYKPDGLSPTWVKARRKEGYHVEYETWRENLILWESMKTTGAKKSKGKTTRPAPEFTVSIVDEAHALIDSTVEGIRGVHSSGWYMHAGPQAWHIIKASDMAVFLLDSEQSYRDNETTTRDSILNWAKEFEAGAVEEISLHASQFRCGGSTEYVDWLDNLLDLRGGPSPGSLWRLDRASGDGQFGFEIVADPSELDERLRPLLAQNGGTRLVASYARKWVTKNVDHPHRLPPDQMDFNIPFVRDGVAKTWSRIWNFAPKQNYTLFIQARRGTEMGLDPLCEVGCPYVMRGFDFEHLGVLWLSDLVWRKDRWYANIPHIYETAWPNTKKAAKTGGKDLSTNQELLSRLQRGYRILLSRAIRGVYVWFEDEETRQHVEDLLRR